MLKIGNHLLGQFLQGIYDTGIFLCSNFSYFAWINLDLGAGNSTFESVGCIVHFEIAHRKIHQISQLNEIESQLIIITIADPIVHAVD